jgi:hypothetical protein
MCPPKPGFPCFPVVFVGGVAANALRNHHLITAEMAGPSGYIPPRRADDVELESEVFSAQLDGFHHPPHQRLISSGNACRSTSGGSASSSTWTGCSFHFPSIFLYGGAPL